MTHTDPVRQYIRDFREGKIETGQSTHIPFLNTYFLWKKNEFNVVLGHEGSGKTSLWLFVKALRSYYNDEKHLIFSSENQLGDLIMEIQQWVTGEHIKTMSDEKAIKSYNWVLEHFDFIQQDEDEPYRLPDLLAIATEIYEKKDRVHSSLMIDPYNSLLGSQSYDYQTEAITRMRHWAKKHCSVDVLIHPVTDRGAMIKDKNHKAYGHMAPPGRHDATGGSFWIQRADSFTVLHRYKFHPELNHITEWHQYKIKTRLTGGSETFKDDPVEFVFIDGGLGFKVNGYNPFKRTHDPVISHEDIRDPSTINLKSDENQN